MVPNLVLTAPQMVHIFAPTQLATHEDGGKMWTIWQALRTRIGIAVLFAIIYTVVLNITH